MQRLAEHGVDGRLQDTTLQRDSGGKRATCFSCIPGRGGRHTIRLPRPLGKPFDRHPAAFRYGGKRVRLDVPRRVLFESAQYDPEVPSSQAALFVKFAQVRPAHGAPTVAGGAVLQDPLEPFPERPHATIVAQVATSVVRFLA